MTQRPHYASEAPDKLSELATKVHDLMVQMLLVDRGDPGLEDDLAWASGVAEEIRARLERHGKSHHVRLGAEGDPEDARPYYVRGALVGPHHPMYLPAEFETEGEVTRGRVQFDLLWEGPPGCVHGGYVAYFFDCAMGHHNMIRAIPGMTGTLTIRYRRPTPLYTELNFEVRTTHESGRKILDEGVLRSGDDIVAEAEGLFVMPKDFAANVAKALRGQESG